MKTTLATILIGLALCLTAGAQSLQETFDWMTNTLKPTEGNNFGIHRPWVRGRDDIRDNIDAYNSETITKFSYVGCQVEFNVDVFNHDMVLMGKWYDRPEVDSFNLKDIDPDSVIIAGADLVWADDMEEHVVVFKTTNAQPKIHGEVTASSGQTGYARSHKETDSKGVVKTWGEGNDELCKAEPGNTAYCDYKDKKEAPMDMTWSSF